MQACTPPAEVQRLRSQLATPELAVAVGGGTAPLHSPTRQLLFWDFCEALVRIAHLKFRHLPSLQQRLHQLLHINILPHAVKVIARICLVKCCCYQEHNLVSLTCSIQECKICCPSGQESAHCSCTAQLHCCSRKQYVVWDCDCMELSATVCQSKDCCHSHHMLSCQQ